MAGLDGTQAGPFHLWCLDFTVLLHEGFKGEGLFWINPAASVYLIVFGGSRQDFSDFHIALFKMLGFYVFYWWIAHYFGALCWKATHKCLNGQMLQYRKGAQPANTYACNSSQLLRVLSSLSLVTNSVQNTQHLFFLFSTEPISAVLLMPQQICPAKALLLQNKGLTLWMKRWVSRATVIRKKEGQLAALMLSPAHTRFIQSGSSAWAWTGFMCSPCFDPLKLYSGGSIEQ